MNAKSILRVLIVVLAALALTALVAAAQEQPVVPATVPPESSVPPPWWNILCNGSFETGVTIPDCWSKDTFQPGAKFKWDSTVAFDGGKSVKITLDTVNDSRWIQTVAVARNTDYVLSGWIRTQNVTGVEGANLSLPMGVFIHTPPLTGTNDWTFVKVVFNSGSWDEIIVAARLGMYGDMSTGTAWFDKVQIAPIENLYLSSSQSGTVAGVKFAPADILVHDPVRNTWAMYFDASDVGITKNVDAFELTGDVIWMSLGSAQNIPGYGMVQPQDVIQFAPTSTGVNTAGSFSGALDGSVYELEAAGENIDALEVDTLISSANPGAYYSFLEISTSGAMVAQGVSKGRDEDVFDGPGSWMTLLDGSTVPGLGSEDIWGLSFHAHYYQMYYLSTQDTYYPGDGRAITNKQIFALETYPTMKVLSPVFWSGPDHGFNYIIDGFSIE